ncbi:MAG TPA: hypothetical protein DCF45_01710 [Gammaproteobacteria bacterium]|nr:hypothetical protein [Gammaproteobacteria bacterium]
MRVRALKWLPIVLVVAACQPFTTQKQGPFSSSKQSAPEASLVKRVKLFTDPPGGSIRVVENGKQVTHGETLEFYQGRYQLEAELTGYRDGALLINVEPSLPSTVIVPLGNGFARLSVTSDPAGAVLKLDGETVGTTPVLLEVDSVAHQVELELDGYQALSVPVSLLPGEQRSLSYQLDAVESTAILEINTTPSGALLRLDGTLIGHSPLILNDIPSGDHELVAELIAEDFTRLSASMKLELEKGKRYPLELTLTQRKATWSEVVRRGENQLDLEPSGVSSNGVAANGSEHDSVLGDSDSLVAAIELSAELEANLRDYWFVSLLNRWLRNGDGLKLYRQGDSVGALYKSQSHSEAQMISQLKHMGISPRRQGLQISAARLDQFKALLFRFYGLRGGYPLLNLTAPQLSEEQLKISKMAQDGQVIILAADGDLTVAGYEPDLRESGLTRFRLPVASEQLEVTWRPMASGRLLVTAASSPDFEGVGSPATLSVGDKQIFNPVPTQYINGILQLSFGPDIRGWRQKWLQPLKVGGSAQLKPMFEIGPHIRPGQYQRIWLVDYSIDNVPGQRQLELSYLVGSGQRSFNSDHFLRRDGFSKAIQ